jgi:hypothetical protein
MHHREYQHFLVHYPIEHVKGKSCEACPAKVAITNWIALRKLTYEQANTFQFSDEGTSKSLFMRIIPIHYALNLVPGNPLDTYR